MQEHLAENDLIYAPFLLSSVKLVSPVSGRKTWSMESLRMVQSKADDLIRCTNYAEAINLYTMWLERNLPTRSFLQQPFDVLTSIALAYNNRGHAKYLKVDFDGALIDYSAGLKFDPTLPVLYYNRGTIMYRMGYFNKAAVDMLVCVKLEPSCKEFHVALLKTLDQIQSDGCAIY